MSDSVPPPENVPPPPGSVPPPPAGPPPAGGVPAPTYAPATAAPSNGMGTAALVMGILQFLCLGTIGSVLAVIFGKIGMNKADRGEATNRGVAKAGFILGIIGLILSVLGAILFAVIIAKAPKSIEGLCALPLQTAGTNGNLEGCTIAGEDFAGKSYTGWTINRTNMTGTNFSGTSWSNSEITNSNLTGANFQNCTMSGVRLNGSSLDGANFGGCTFTNVTLGGATYNSSTVFPEGFAP